MSADEQALAFAQQRAGTQDGFDQRKAKIVEDLAGNTNDFSPKGSVDEPVVPLVNLLNAHQDYVTTSSCSGRISCHVVDEEESKGGHWAYISHSTAEPAEIVSKLLADIREADSPSRTTSFKFEPFVMHAECRTLTAATGLLAVAIGCGFRESGIMNAEKRVMLAVRGSLRIEAPVAVGCELLVPESYLTHLAELGNTKLTENLRRIDKFYAAVSLWLSAQQPKAAPAEASSLGLVVQGRVVEQLRVALDRRGWLDNSRGIAGHGAGNVALPLTSCAAVQLQDALSVEGAAPEDEIVQMILAGGGGSVEHVEQRAAGKQKRRATPYQKLLTSCTELIKHLPTAERETLEKEVPKKWEAMGDLVLLPADSFASHSRWHELGGDEMWTKVAAALKAKRVARQAAIDPGRMRQSRVALLLGEDGWVELKQHGVTYQLDVTKVMFSSGNTTERRRMGQLDCEGQTVVDIYCGIGYLSIPIIVRCPTAHLHSCEINPDSVEALTKSLAANGVQDRCTIHHGDNRTHAPKALADRVLLGLIPSSRTGWPVAAAALKPSGGWLHVHENVAHGELESFGAEMVAEFAQLFHDIGQSMTFEIVHVENVKQYSPRVDHLVYDVLVKPCSE